MKAGSAGEPHSHWKATKHLSFLGLRGFLPVSPQASALFSEETNFLPFCRAQSPIT